MTLIVKFVENNLTVDSPSFRQQFLVPILWNRFVRTLRPIPI
jgi:hypothetical protein